MKTHGALRSEEANQAASEGGKGALIGATRWAVYGAIVSGAGYAMSPIYRGLTIQFKVFIQMSFMVLGGSLEADRRVRAYEARLRVEKRLKQDRAAWERYEQEFNTQSLEKKGQ
ncbi:hypothetical protein F5884DRAFT_93078 [Xylogone sp. PMI_703]|nr:hypothetical protein F5884DRAFT_93078 [Xylogone sp. PMI_703]